MASNPGSTDSPGTKARLVGRALSQGAVASLLSEADVIFTSSLSDGMNLVPLQGVIAHTCRPDAKRGVIIAGQDTGAVRTYREFAHDGLRPVDPLSPDDMDAALRESLDNSSPRVSDRFGLAVRALDAHHWAQRFLAELHEVTG